MRLMEGDEVPLSLFPTVWEGESGSVRPLSLPIVPLRELNGVVFCDDAGRELPTSHELRPGVGADQLRRI
jgi:hypothetical protein